MCLIAFAIGAHPACPLLIAGNRDEFFDRPTAPLHRWTPPGSATAIWAGRDLRDGGTWLGLGENGRVAMLTNVRSALATTGTRSRGELPTRWLAGTGDIDALTDGIDPAAYGGFNLVVGDFHAGQWAWLSNRDVASPHTEVATACFQKRLLAPGLYGLSNAALDTPWFKTERLKAAMQQALDRMHDAETAAPADLLAGALAERQTATDAQLPATGVPLAMERALSSPFVDMAGRGYGTRSSLVAEVRAHRPRAWHLRLTEWSHAAPAGGRHAWTPQPGAQTQFTWDTPADA